MPKRNYSSGNPDVKSDFYVVYSPSKSGGMAPVYGMAASLPFKGIVRDLLKKYMDLYYRIIL